MRERVTNRTDAAAVRTVAQSCPKAREFPEQLVVLFGLTALVLALAAWAHAIGPQDPAQALSAAVAVEVPAAR